MRNLLLQSSDEHGRRLCSSVAFQGVQPHDVQAQHCHRVLQGRLLGIILLHHSSLTHHSPILKLFRPRRGYPRLATRMPSGLTRTARFHL